MRADNRSALLVGARACLDELGYARTRARDVAEAAGVSLAAIGYHFGTTDALLVEALVGGLEEWSAELDSRLESVRTVAPPDRLGATWSQVIESFEGARGVLGASFELMARADHDESVQAQLRHAMEGARRGLAAQIAGIDPASEPERALRVGAACYAIVSGLMVQWLVDPVTLPNGDQLAMGLRDLVGVIADEGVVVV